MEEQDNERHGVVRKKLRVGRLLAFLVLFWRIGRMFFLGQWLYAICSPPKIPVVAADDDMVFDKTLNKRLNVLILVLMMETMNIRTLPNVQM